MTPQLQDLIATARPGTRIRIIEIEVPGDPDAATVTALFDESPASGEAVRIRSASPERPHVADEQRLRRLSELAPRPLKLSQWPKVINKLWAQPLSERELERAVQAGALESQIKGEGKDHRAATIDPQQMMQYLALCQAVQRGLEPRPQWWAAVRKGPNASIRQGS